jgi:hypothetical protein
MKTALRRMSVQLHWRIVESIEVVTLGMEIRGERELHSRLGRPALTRVPAVLGKDKRYGSTAKEDHCPCESDPSGQGRDDRLCYQKLCD